MASTVAASDVATSAESVASQVADGVAATHRTLQTHIKRDTSSTQDDDQDLVEYMLFCEPDRGVETQIQDIINMFGLEGRSGDMFAHISLWKGKLPKTADTAEVAAKVHSGIKEWRKKSAGKPPVLNFDVVAFGQHHASFVAVCAKTTDLLSLHDSIEKHVIDVAGLQKSQFVPYLTFVRGTKFEVVIEDHTSDHHFENADGKALSQGSLIASKLYLTKMAMGPSPYNLVLFTEDV